MKKVLVIFSLISLLFLSGCYDSREISRTVAVIAIGIDKGENARYRVSFHLEKEPKNGESGEEGGGGSGGSGGSGGEESGKEKKNKDVITVEAPTVLSAFERANYLVSVDVSMENTKMIILSEDICKEGIYPPIYELVSSTELKNNAYVAVAKGKADEILLGINPEQEEYVSVYYERVLFNQYEEKTRYFLLDEVYFNMIAEPGQDLMLPTVAFREKDSFEEGGNDDTKMGISAGSIPKSSKHEVEFLGGAAFKDEKLIGYLDESEIIAASILYGDFRTRDFTLEYPENSKNYVVVSIKQQKTPKRQNKVINGKIYETFDVNLIGDYQLVPDGQNYNEFNKEFTSFLKKEISDMCLALLKKSAQEYKADICSTGKHLRSEFLTEPEFISFDYMEKLGEADYKVDVKLKVRRAGRMTFE